MKHKCLVALLVVFILGLAQADINRDFLNGANSMIGNDVNAVSLLGSISNTASWSNLDESAANLNTRIDSSITINIRLLFHNIEFKVYPWKRLSPLRFGANTKIQSLTTFYDIKPTAASVTLNGLFAVKQNGVLQVRQAHSSASAVPNKQYTQQQVRKCTRVLFWDDCKTETVKTERGLFHHEIEAITSKLSREAAIAMVNEIKAKTGLRQVIPIEGLRELSSLYLDESNKLRSLYTQLEYDYSELKDVTVSDFRNVITSASLGLVKDDWTLTRMQTIVNSSSKSSFMVFPSDDYFFVFSILNQSGNIHIKLSTFRVQGQLPKGAFVSSVGSWKTERAGQAANPSLHQIVGIFPALK